MKRVATACVVSALCISMVIFPVPPVLKVPAAAQSLESPGFLTSPPPVQPVDCSQLTALGYDRQMNMYADLVRIQCGLEPAGEPGPIMNASGPAIPGKSSNVDVITGAETFPHVTQSESMIATKDGNTIVINYNDSTGAASSPPNYSGLSVSFNGGFSFQRILPSPLQGGFFNAGDPIVVFNQKFNAWFGGDLISACSLTGGFGIGIWSSTNAVTWAPSSCAHVGSGDDRESMWVDNNPASPCYGQMYVSYNNFALPNANLQVVHSSTASPISWTAPITLTGTFIRDVQLTGSPGADGTVFLAAMDEGGGQFNLRQNLVFRSTNCGASWALVYAGPLFTPPGDNLCSPGSYFVRIDPIWRHMGWGQPAVGPAGVIHYAYAGADLDPGDIFYIRSTDNGTTWSAPIVLNTDDGNGLEHWMPQVSATAAGKVQVSWYDRRDTTDGVNYEYFGITSLDGGTTFGIDFPISDIVVAQPAQPDPLVQACYAGDYNYHISFGTTNYVTWTDGRVPIAGVNQQDVFFDKVP